MLLAKKEANERQQKTTIKHKRPTWRKEESAIRIRLHTPHSYMPHACKRHKKCFWSHKLFDLAANRKSSNGIYYKRVFYIVTLKTCAVRPLASSIERCQKESVRQLCCKWTCLTNFQFAYSARIHILTSSSTSAKEWCYIFISSNFFVFEEGKKWKRKIHLDLLHILL